MCTEISFMHQEKVAADKFCAHVTCIIMHNCALAVLFLEKHFMVQTNCLTCQSQIQ